MQRYRSGYNGPDSKSGVLATVPWVRIPPAAPHWYTGYDTIACVLFCVSTRKNPWYKGKARQVGTNMHLPISLFCFLRVACSSWRFLDSHPPPPYILAYLKKRQNVDCSASWTHFVNKLLYQSMKKPRWFSNHSLDSRTLREKYSIYNGSRKW